MSGNKNCCIRYSIVVVQISCSNLDGYFQFIEICHDLLEFVLFIITAHLPQKQ